MAINEISSIVFVILLPISSCQSVTNLFWDPTNRCYSAASLQTHALDSVTVNCQNFRACCARYCNAVNCTCNAACANDTDVLIGTCNCKQSESIGTTEPSQCLVVQAELQRMQNLLKHGVEISNDKATDLSNLLENIDQWGLDIFKLAKLTDNRPLTCITYTLFKKRELFKKLGLNPFTLITYMNAVEDNYLPNYYHNSIHAADVTQSLHVLLSSRFVNDAFTDDEVLAAIFAASIHDVHHPGVTNQYILNTGQVSDPFQGITFKNESALEHHHLEVAFNLLKNPTFDILLSFNKTRRETFTKIVTDMVLATDMAKHSFLLADLKDLLEAKKNASQSMNGKTPQHLLLENFSDRIRVLKHMLHLCDLSNPTEPNVTYQQWASRVMAEFWREGDWERELGLPLCPTCDRQKNSLDKSQVSFIDNVANPLWQTWAELVYPDAQPMLDQMVKNREFHYNRTLANG